MTELECFSFVPGTTDDDARIEVHRTGLNQVAILLRMRDANGKQHVITSRITEQGARELGGWLMNPQLPYDTQ